MAGLNGLSADPVFFAVEYAKDNDAILRHPILHHIWCVQYTHDDLPIVRVPLNGLPQVWIGREKLGPLDQIATEEGSKTREMSMEEFGKTVEVGKSISRPLDFHCSDHGLKLSVPQVRSHRSTSA